MNLESDDDFISRCYQQICRYFYSKGVSIRKCTHYSQKKTVNKDVLHDFIQGHNRNVVLNQYQDYQIYNCDETNVDFDMPESYTLEMKGEHQVTIRNTDCAKRCSVMLVCSRLVKLPIFIIFDGSESKFGHLKKKFSDGKIPERYSEGVL